MNVLNYAPLFLPHIGGVEQNIYHFAKKSKHQHNVLTDLIPNTCLKESLENIKIYRVPPTRSLGIGLIDKSINVLSSLVREVNKASYIRNLDYDLMHIRASFVQPDIFYLIDQFFGVTHFKKIAAWKICKKPIVVTFHSLPSHDIPLTINDKLSYYAVSEREQKSWIGIERLLCNRANEVICVDKYMEKYLSTLFPDKEIHYIPSAIDRKQFYPMPKNQALKALPIQIRRHFTSKFVVLYLGRLDPFKGVYVLESLSKALPPWAKLITVGKSSVQLNAFKNTVHVGPVPNELIKYLISACDVVYNPILSQGTSRVAFETMACGKPIIMIGKGDDRYPIIDKKNAFLVNGNNEIIERINELRTSKTLVRQIEQNALKTASENSVDLMAKKVDALYEQAVQ